MTEAARYLRKAWVSLASARAELRAGRYNSVANRSYYACFQAAVAALIHYGVRSSEMDWEHRFVAREFALRLIRERRVLVRAHSGTLSELFALRIVADYREFGAPAGRTESALRRAERFLSAIEGKMGTTEAREAAIEYEVGVKTKLRTPDECVVQVKEAILADFPDAEISTCERGPRDFTLDVWGIDDDQAEKFNAIYALVTDVLVDDDLWVVVLPLPGRDSRD